jgi:hypothetical protein
MVGDRGAEGRTQVSTLGRLQRLNFLECVHCGHSLRNHNFEGDLTCIFPKCADICKEFAGVGFSKDEQEKLNLVWGKTKLLRRAKKGDHSAENVAHVRHVFEKLATQKGEQSKCR